MDSVSVPPVKAIGVTTNTPDAFVVTAAIADPFVGVATTLTLASGAPLVLVIVPVSESAGVWHVTGMVTVSTLPATSV